MLDLMSECVVHTTTYPTYYWSRVGPIVQEHAAPDTCVTRNTGSVLVISPKSIVARHRPRAQPWPQASLTRFRLLRLYHRENSDLMLHLYTLNTVSNRRFISKAVHQLIYNYKLRRILVILTYQQSSKYSNYT